MRRRRVARGSGEVLYSAGKGAASNQESWSRVEWGRKRQRIEARERMGGRTRGMEQVCYVAAVGALRHCCCGSEWQRYSGGRATGRCPSQSKSESGLSDGAERYVAAESRSWGVFIGQPRIRRARKPMTHCSGARLRLRVGPEFLVARRRWRVFFFSAASVVQASSAANQPALFRLTANSSLPRLLFSASETSQCRKSKFPLLQWAYSS